MNGQLLGKFSRRNQTDQASPKARQATKKRPLAGQSCLEAICQKRGKTEDSTPGHNVCYAALSHRKQSSKCGSHALRSADSLHCHIVQTDHEKPTPLWAILLVVGHALQQCRWLVTGKSLPQPGVRQCLSASPDSSGSPVSRSIRSLPRPRRGTSRFPVA